MRYYRSMKTIEIKIIVTDEQGVSREVLVSLAELKALLEKE